MHAHRIGVEPLTALGLLVLAAESIGLYLRMMAQAIPAASGRRLLVMVAVLPLLAVTQACNWMGLLLDELLFRRYRRQPVEAPVFIVGIPRSGTTLLHRTLAADRETFSAPALWELALAPSIVQKRILHGLHRLDRRVGHPAGRLLGWLQSRWLGRMEAIHAIGLAAPEEDFIWLTPAAACFGLIVLFPEADALWCLARFDTRVPASRRRRLLAFYRGCVQRHLYAQGNGRRFLSKNVSFTPWLGSLMTAFPDACLIGCTRPLEAVFPSQLSALRPAMDACGSDVQDADFQARMLDMLAGYYTSLERLETLAPARSHTVAMDALQADLAGCARAVYACAGARLPDAFPAHLEQAAAAARVWHSGHRYSLQAYGWDREELRRRFDDCLRAAVAGHGAVPATEGVAL